MILFTKENCAKCTWIKNYIDSIDSWPLNIILEYMDIEHYSGLAELAWHGLVGVAEKSLPILLTEDKTSIVGAIRIKQYLQTFIK